MKKPLPPLFGLYAVAALLLLGRADAAEFPSEHLAFFESKIRPVLVEHCYECHSAKAEQPGGNLRLDTREAILSGGQSGPALVPREVDASLIVQALRYDGLEMPPDQPLPATVVSEFARWVELGAPDPRGDPTSTADTEALDQAALWSFYPRSDPPLPDVSNSAWPRDPLDTFVLAGLESQGMTPAGDVTVVTLVRRLYHDLIGLPPTFEQLRAFEKRHERLGAAAVSHLVDELLARSEFGERWGRHWLDVARFAESNGDDGLGRNATFPHAWRYRDYVIDAFNRDLPFDRFVTEQVAGDLLPASTADERNRQLVATGFLAVGSKPAAAMNKNFAMDVVDDQINAVSTAFMALSVSCARCHDHKHDPIPTRDYYALAGIFKSTETLYGLAANERLTAPATPLHELKSVWDAGTSPADNRAAALRFPADYAAAISQLRPDVHERLSDSPPGLAVTGEITFAEDQFAGVKNARFDGHLSEPKDAYSVAFWFRNDLANDARPITAYLFSRARHGDAKLPGDHLGIGGKHDKSRTGKLFIFNGNEAKQSLAGATEVPSGIWQHVVLVRDGNHVKPVSERRTGPGARRRVAGHVR